MYNSTIRRFVQDQVIEHQTRPRTLQKRISCLKSFCRFCAKENWITVEFMVGIQAPKTNKKLPVYMRLIVLQQLFRFLEWQTKIRAAKPCDVQASSDNRHVSARISGFRFNVGKFDLEWNTVRIYEKGNKERVLPLHPMVLPLILKYREHWEPFRLHSKEFFNIFVTFTGWLFFRSGYLTAAGASWPWKFSNYVHLHPCRSGTKETSGSIFSIWFWKE